MKNEGFQNGQMHSTKRVCMTMLVEGKCLPGLRSRVVLDSFLGADSTLTHMTIQVTQLRLNSNPKFANMTQL